MRILITNDDGIKARGLYLLADWARTLGEVTVVAPKIEQSGKSHGINIISPFEITEEKLLPAVEAYAVDSTPADCVRFGIVGLKREYDLILSGMNAGFNMGKDIVYSGTVGAIYEAYHQNAKAAIAFSTAPDTLDGAAKHFDRVLRYFDDRKLLDHHMLYNVNIPAEGKEIVITRQGCAYYSDDFEKCGENLYKQVGVMVYHDRNDITYDTDAVTRGHISITPMSTERTDLSVFHALRGINSVN